MRKTTCILIMFDFHWKVFSSTCITSSIVLKLRKLLLHWRVLQLIRTAQIRNVAIYVLYVIAYGFDFIYEFESTWERRVWLLLWPRVLSAYVLVGVVAWRDLYFQIGCFFHSCCIVSFFLWQDESDQSNSHALIILRKVSQNFVIRSKIRSKGCLIIFIRFRW